MASVILLYITRVTQRLSKPKVIAKSDKNPYISAIVLSSVQDSSGIVMCPYPFSVGEPESCRKPGAASRTGLTVDRQREVAGP